jgi:uncharacterized phiE125 gp8 family phage protein
MSGTLLQAPAATPLGGADEWLTLEEVRMALRIDGSFEDEMLQRLIDTARDFIEGHGLAVHPRSATLAFDAFDELMWIPLAPVRAITSVIYTDGDGASVTMDPADYRLIQRHGMWRLARAFNKSWPSAASGEQIRVTADVGWALREELPETIRQAALLLIGHYVKHREDATTGTLVEIPNGVRDLLSQHRIGWVA